MYQCKQSVSIDIGFKLWHKRQASKRTVPIISIPRDSRGREQSFDFSDSSDLDRSIENPNIH